jgi:hypothetical protein
MPGLSPRFCATLSLGLWAMLVGFRLAVAQDVTNWWVWITTLVVSFVLCGAFSINMMRIWDSRLWGPRLRFWVWGHVPERYRKWVRRW